eukprot:4303482-Prymnesium_polylepis.2
MISNPDPRTNPGPSPHPHPGPSPNPNPNPDPGGPVTAATRRPPRSNANLAAPLSRCRPRARSELAASSSRAIRMPACVARAATAARRAWQHGARRS